MARIVLITNGEDIFVGGSQLQDVIDLATPGNVFTVLAAAGPIVISPEFNQGGNTVDLPGDAEDYTAVRDGSNVRLTRNDGQVTITLPVSGNVNTLIFDNATRDLRVVGGQIQIGSQVIDNPAGEQLDPGAQTAFQLTQGADTDPAFTGSAGADTYRADVVQTALLPIQTLTNNDNFNAAGGRDRLIAQIVNANTIPAGLFGLEEIEFQNPGGVIPLPGGTVDLRNTNALDTLGFRSISAPLNLINIPTSIGTINLTDTLGGTVLGVGFQLNVLGGTTDSVAVNLDNFNGVLILNGVGADRYETVTVDSRGGPGPLGNILVLNGSAAAATTVNVTGNTALNISGTALSFASLRTFNAAALDNNLIAAFTGNAGAATAVSVTGAGGNNLLSFAGTTAALTVNTVGGEDTVIFNGHVGATTVNVGNGTNAVTYGGTVTGNINVTGGTGTDLVTVGDPGVGGATVTGAVTVNTDGGVDLLVFNTVVGVINLNAGDGNDTITFNATNANGTNFFTGNDTADGGAGTDLLILGVTNNGDGTARNLFANGANAINGIETVRHVGVIGGGGISADFNVDMALAGSATRVELRGNGGAGAYTDDVFVTNLDQEVVAVQGFITDRLELSRALLTVPQFFLELGNGAGGIDIGVLDVGAGTDLLNIDSVGGGFNRIFDVSEVDADVIITGNTRMVFGSATVAQAYDLDNGTVDVRSTGNDDVFVAGGNQTLIDGAGNDLFALFLNGGANDDLVLLAAGNNIVRLFNDDGADGAQGDLHEIRGFNVTGEGRDEIQVALGNFSFDSTNGATVTAGDVVIRDYTVGDIVDLDTSNVTFIRFVTQVNGNGLDAEQIFELAIGSGTIDVSDDPGEYLAAVYDSGAGEMVLFKIDEVGGLISSADDVDGIARIEMSYADYLALTGDNLSFV